MATLYQNGQGYKLYTVLESYSNDAMPYGVRTLVYVHSPVTQRESKVDEVDPFIILDNRDYNPYLMRWLSRLALIIEEEKRSE